MDKAIVFSKGRLTCIGQDHTRIPTVLARLHGGEVKCLDMSENQLISLQGIELFPHLEELIVDKNEISENSNFPKSSSVTTFSANKNKIENLEIFLRKVSESLPNLRYLSLLGNRVCPDQLSDPDHDEQDYARYRCYVLSNLPNLAFLDSSPVLPLELLEAKQRGHLMRVAKPVNNDHSNGRGEASSPYQGSAFFTPLPRSRREVGDHQGAYGKCRYKYSGKHSEGNRFIQNQDL